MAIIPPTAGTSVPITQEVWAAFLISQINANGGSVPYTQNNIDNIVLWMTSEEPAANWFHNWNPLNINAGGSGSDTFPNLTAAANSTGHLIATGYPGILSALNANAPLPVFRSAVVTSPWASGHYSGGSAFASTLPGMVSAGPGDKVLPADAGGVVPASPTPLGPLGAGVNVGGNLGWASALGTLLSDLISANWWKRVGVFSLGGVLVIGGIVLFVSTTKTGQKVESDAAVAAVAA